MDKTNEIKVSLRGKVITISAAIESFVTGIIQLTYAEFKPAESLNIRNLKMYQKVNLTRDLIADYFPDIAKTANPIFNKYSGLSEFRNRMAHCEIFWNDPYLLVNRQANPPQKLP